MDDIQIQMIRYPYPRSVKELGHLIEKWGKLKDLPAPLHVGEEDIMRILKVPDIEHLLYEVRYLSKYIEEEFLSKIGLSFHTWRSEVRMLKISSKAPDLPVPVSMVALKRQARGGDPQSLKKKKFEGVATNANKAPPSSSPARLHILEDVWNHQCIGRRRADDLLSRKLLIYFSLFSSIYSKDLEVKLTHSLNEWNNEFMKIKYLQGEYKQKYDLRTNEVKVLEEELIECRTELANIVHSVSLQNQQIDQLQIDFKEAQAMITQLRKDQKASVEKVATLEAENKRSQALIAEEVVLSDLEYSRIIEDFKKSIAFKTIIQDHVQEARDHIYDVERKAGVIVEGLTPNQASGDPPSDFDGDEIESELHKAFALEVDDEIVDIE
ncbi:hypothetical protein M5K25_017736 [Dendrobium thyrsiflorum]|uniref:Uncharacterized protein n=1 Tax=Dendrobium thyrsiflorum TaxID=117978 RepID=A0ABD0UN07_DENTH